MSQSQPSPVPDFFPGELPRFRIGHIVRHRRYGYRGVVVDFDMACHADDAWYASNESQPDRDQPWYHVLVHGSSGNTYVAEENLEIDPDAEQIEHPLVAEFFDGFSDHAYHRNDALWPQW